MRSNAFLLLCIFLAASGCSRDEAPKTRNRTSTSPPTSDTTRPFALMSVSEREQLRETLMKEGRYDCCVKPGCTECIGLDDSCGCYLSIKNNDPICGECLDGYKEGRGKLKLVSIVELEEIRNKALRKED